MTRPHGPCDVCGGAARLEVRASSAGPMSFAYCPDCLESGAEPYGALVAYLCGYVTPVHPLEQSIAPDYLLIVDATLAVAGRTREQFIADCQSAFEEYAAWQSQADPAPVRQFLISLLDGDRPRPYSLAADEEEAWEIAGELLRSNRSCGVVVHLFENDQCVGQKHIDGWSVRNNAYRNNILMEGGWG